MKIQNLIRDVIDADLVGINTIKNYYLDPVPSLQKGKERLRKSKHGTGVPPNVDGGGDSAGGDGGGE